MVGEEAGGALLLAWPGCFVVNLPARAGRVMCHSVSTVLESWLFINVYVYLSVSLSLLRGRKRIMKIYKTFPVWDHFVFTNILWFYIFKCIILKLVCQGAVKRKQLDPQFFTLYMLRQVVSLSIYCMLQNNVKLLCFICCRCLQFEILSYTKICWMFS